MVRNFLFVSVWVCVCVWKTEWDRDRRSNICSLKGMCEWENANSISLTHPEKPLRSKKKTSWNVFRVWCSTEYELFLRIFMCELATVGYSELYVTDSVSSLPWHRYNPEGLCNKVTILDKIILPTLFLNRNNRVWLYQKKFVVHFALKSANIIHFAKTATSDFLIMLWFPLKL